MHMNSALRPLHMYSPIHLNSFLSTVLMLINKETGGCEWEYVNGDVNKDREFFHFGQFLLTGKRNLCIIKMFWILVIKSKKCKNKFPSMKCNALSSIGVQK